MALADEIDVPGRRSREAPTVAAQVGPITTASLRREGDYWAIEFGSDAFRVRDMKGLRLLARLVQRPGQEIHAVDLAGGGGERVASVRTADIDGTVDAMAGTGPMLDEAAKAAYRERLTDLRAELAEASDWNDPERAARVQDEIDALAHELSAAVGLAGRDRNASSPAERARVSVTRAIRAALDRVTEYSPALGGHFAATVRTGTYCSYIPDPRAPIEWRT
jgi:hypothetical protein